MTELHPTKETTTGQTRTEKMEGKFDQKAAFIHLTFFFFFFAELHHEVTKQAESDLRMQYTKEKYSYTNGIHKNGIKADSKEPYGLVRLERAVPCHWSRRKAKRALLYIHM